MLITFKNFCNDLKRHQRQSEKGNVLFLILIAVALFAALSYAVTQSSRTGGGATDGEANLVNSAQVTQYPASVRTAIVRMIIGGTDVTQLEFNAPSEYGSLTETSYGVFHPSGGGATHVTAPPEVMQSNNQGQWVFSSDYAIEFIGTTENDIIALLPGISTSICERLNTELGVPSATDTGGDGDSVGVGPTTLPVLATHTMDSGNSGIGTAANGVAAFFIDGDFSGQPFGCYDQDDTTESAGELVYFHVLVER